MKVFVSVMLGVWCSVVAAGEVYTAQGVLVGEVTAGGALLQVRLTNVAGPELDDAGDVPGAAGVACFEYGLKEDLSDARRTEWMTAQVENDFIVRGVLAGLKEGTTYYYRPVFGVTRDEIRSGNIGQFATLPGTGSEREVSFIVGSCMNYF
ncbi:MAG: PhoD-like phosphatase N-terminal domain-containing protein, partial [Planctomycetaceae bacterium]|nr:PhoD-like phosphatase N-terminal domain-containing protein [Planctomycetaceae bacterium]